MGATALAVRGGKREGAVLILTPFRANCELCASLRANFAIFGGRFGRDIGRGGGRVARAIAGRAAPARAQSLRDPIAVGVHFFGVGIGDAPVHRAAHRERERLADFADFAQRQLRFAQIAVTQTALHDLLNVRFDFVGRDVGHRARRGFESIGQQQNRRLARARTRAGVTINLLVHAVFAGALARAVQKISDRALPMMRRDHLQHRQRQPNRAPQFQTIFDVRFNQKRRQSGRQTVVNVVAVLILDEAVRAPQLADVVIQTATRHKSESAPTRLAAASAKVATIKECV